MAEWVSRAGANLHGTRPYWLDRRKELQAMIKQLHCPHLFLTFSAADVQWPDLHRHMPSQAPPNATDQERVRIFNQNLNENPGIAAYYFQKRWELYLKLVLKPKFNVVDYWFRYEWQHRGSSHVHVFFWIKDAPKVEDLKLENAESVEAFIKFWDPLISTHNPAVGEPKTTIHPCAQEHGTLNYSQRELAQLLNRVQRHTRCTSYCLRRRKGAPKDAEMICRFKYPQELRDVTDLANDDRGFLQLLTKRNDELLNSYNPLQILGWHANVDFTPCVSHGSVDIYISKYCSKTEVKSEPYGVILNNILQQQQQLQDDCPAKVAFQKLLSKLIIERDWSTQECMHILHGCKMFSSSRQYRSLCISLTRSNQFLDPDEMGDDDSPAVRSTLIDRYEARAPGILNDKSLYEIFKHYRWEKGEFKHCPRTIYIVNIWPLYTPDQDDMEMYENWCRAKLQLHHPYRDLDNLKKDVYGNDIGWIAAYNVCKEYCPEHDEDPLMTEEEKEEQDTVEDLEDEFEEEEENDEMEGIHREDWQVMAGQGPRGTWIISRLGMRDLDRDSEYWHASFGEYGLDEVKSAEMYLEEQKWLATNLVDEIPDVDISKLNVWSLQKSYNIIKILSFIWIHLLYELILTVLRELANHSLSGPSQRQLQPLLINKAMSLPLYELPPLVLQHSISKAVPYIQHSQFQRRVYHHSQIHKNLHFKSD